MKRTNKKGFTIVELVVVIAVIAILAAVMIPTFSGVTQNAKDAARDADAKTLYSQYIAEQAELKQDPAEDLYIKVVDGTNTYYYEVADGVLNLVETTTQPTGTPVIYPQ